MHKRTDSSNDYFTGRRWNGQRASKSLPGTPQGSGKNISFSPRIQFHDVWSASDYDRRGDIATCNRLTPLLAQQIKEELNNFKMVCAMSCECGRRLTYNSIRKWKFTSFRRLIPTSSEEVCVMITRSIPSIDQTCVHIDE